MRADIFHKAPLKGAISIPTDKAICHRAVLLAALAKGQTDLSPWPSADDCQRTLDVVLACGVRVHKTGPVVSIHGAGPNGFRAPGSPIYCGESGTTYRLAAGVLSGQPFATVLDAGPGLRLRPMKRIIEPLRLMGAELSAADVPGSAKRAGDNHPPLKIVGRRPLRAIVHSPEVASAQVKSAVLLAGLSADGPTYVKELYPTRDHTERALRCFGVSVTKEGLKVGVTPGDLSAPGALQIPGDISSAAFFIVAGVCIPGSAIELKDVSLNPSRCAFLDVLRRMGANITIRVEDEGWEPRGSIKVVSSALRATAVSAEEVPGMIDEIPVLMIAALAAEGTTRFSGLRELRVKETDRIRSMREGIEGLGGTVRLVDETTVEIQGGPLSGGPVSSYGDHRTAMSCAVAGLLAGEGASIEGAECVAKSFPDFFGHLEALGAGVSLIE